MVLLVILTGVFVLMVFVMHKWVFDGFLSLLGPNNFHPFFFRRWESRELPGKDLRISLQ